MASYVTSYPDILTYDVTSEYVSRGEVGRNSDWVSAAGHLAYGSPWFENTSFGAAGTGWEGIDREGEDRDEYPYPSKYGWLRIITASIVVSVIMLIIVLGNALVVIAIAVDRRLAGLQNWFIASLAVSDLFVGLFIMPLSLANELMGYWVFGDVLCELWLSTDVMLCTASILNLCLISLDRYWSITRAMTYSQQRTKKRAVLMISAVWITSMIICLPPLVGWKRPQPTTKPGYPSCILSEEPGYVIYSTIGSFYLPLTLMISVYLKIYLSARSRARRHLSTKQRPTTKRKLAARRAAAAAGTELARLTIPPWGNDPNTSSEGHTASSRALTLTPSPALRISKKCVEEEKGEGRDESDLAMEGRSGNLRRMSSTECDTSSPAARSGDREFAYVIDDGYSRGCAENSGDDVSGRQRVTTTDEEADDVSYRSKTSLLPLTPRRLRTIRISYPGEVEFDQLQTSRDVSTVAEDEVWVNTRTVGSTMTRAVCDITSESSPRNHVTNIEMTSYNTDSDNLSLQPCPPSPSIFLHTLSTTEKSENGALVREGRVSEGGIGGSRGGEAGGADGVIVEGRGGAGTGGGRRLSIRRTRRRTYGSCGRLSNSSADNLPLDMLTSSEMMMMTSTEDISILPRRSFVAYEATRKRIRSALVRDFNFLRAIASARRRDSSDPDDPSTGNNNCADRGRVRHDPTSVAADCERARRRLAKARERRATLVLGVVMASFIGCWLPFFTIYPITLLAGLNVSPEVFGVIFWLGYCNSALNPIIYTIFNREFRQAFRRILARPRRF